MSKQSQDYEVAIVGAGIGGGALATVLARAGLRVLLVEKTLEHRDVVRGEWMAPWGVVEANELGLTDLYLQAGAHRVSVHKSFSDLQEGPTAVMPLVEMGIEMPLCLGHPRTCGLLNQAAVDAGVTYLRGIQNLNVEPGAPPCLSFVHQGREYEIKPKLIVGADGRNGVVAKQIGCQVTHDAEHHLFSGMLVEGAEAWPEDLQIIATEGDVNVLAFPQGSGRVRVYLGWPSEDRGRLVGPGGPARFLESWKLDCVPDAEAIFTATPASPCIAYPNFDAWVDTPVKEGIVLIGDAAGRNDPIIGQGLSITHTDVRQVRDVLLADLPGGRAPEEGWTIEAFDGYVTERQDRMARLRTVARLTTLRESVFGDAGKKLRSDIHNRIEQNEDLAAPFAAAFVGPFAVPGEVFEDAFTSTIAGTKIWDEALP